MWTTGFSYFEPLSTPRGRPPVFLLIPSIDHKLGGEVSAYGVG